MERSMTETTEPTPGRRTAIGKDPIGIDPIGNNPLDLSDAPPTKADRPNRTLLGGALKATAFFTAAVVLGVIVVIAIVVFAMR